MEFNWLASPVEILGDEKKNVRALRCVKMELGEPDDSGRRRPVPVPGSEFELETDMVVFAIGTNANPILGQTSKLKLNKRGYIATDENLATSIAGVYRGRRHRHRRRDGDRGDGRRPQGRARHEGVPRPARHRVRLRVESQAGRASASRARSTASRACGSRDHHSLRPSMSDAAVIERPVKPGPAGAKRVKILTEHIVEVISDSGEGAQRCGQSLGAIAARSGNGIWTVEIIPAEIQPPARSVAGASGIRIRIGAKAVTNGGDQTDLVVAFNEQVLLGRVRAGELKPGATILLEKHVARPQGSADRQVIRRDREVAAGSRLSPDRDSARARMPLADDRRAPGQEHVRAGHAVQHLQPRPPARARAGRPDLRQEGREGHRDQRGAARSRLRLGRGEPRLQVRDSGREVAGAADRRQRQHGDRAGRPRVRHGHLRDVPDHAGYLGLALPVRCVREGRRSRAPGRGRDRRLRVRDRRLVRRQVRGHDHLGTRLLAETGRARARRDGRDPARRRQRPARRAVAPASRPRSSRATS